MLYCLYTALRLQISDSIEISRVKNLKIYVEEPLEPTHIKLITYAGLSSIHFLVTSFVYISSSVSQEERAYEVEKLIRTI
jgi:hypothetical protein